MPDVDLGADTVLCDGQTLTLKPRPSSSGYTWFDETTVSLKEITTSGTYWVKANSECVVRDTIQVNFIECPGMIPNVFTPNGDHANEIFVIENIENHDWNLEVFNRWGRRVYSDRAYRNNWDGRQLENGVYYYVLRSSQLNKEKKGWVQILN